MSSQLAIYNDALTLCGESTLASLTEDRKSRRLLDNVWANGGVNACLEMGQWIFATRTQRLDYDPSITPEFGYRYAFSKASDWVSTTAVCSDEYYNVPLTQYSDEGGYWYCDLTLLYVKFVSNDATYGTNYGIWPQSFADYVAAYFAGKIIGALTSDKNMQDYILHPRTGVEAQRLLKARSKDAMAKPTGFLPEGTWTTARRAGRSSSRRDGGSRNQLIG